MFACARHCTCSIVAALFFVTYDESKKLLAARLGGDYIHGQHMAAAVTAELVSTLIFYY